MKIMFADILLDPKKIGTRVLDFDALQALTIEAISNSKLADEHGTILDGRALTVETEKGAAEGHFNLTLHGHLLERAQKIISGGDGQHTNNPKDYIICKHWSGGIMTCLKREFAAKAKTIKLIIQTKDAYLRDPDLDEEKASGNKVKLDKIYKEKARIERENPTHVVVWVVASAADGKMPMGTLIRNLAGYNEDALKWSADEIRARIKEAYEAERSWCVVADEEV